MRNVAPSPNMDKDKSIRVTSHSYFLRTLSCQSFQMWYAGKVSGKLGQADHPGKHTGQTFPFTTFFLPRTACWCCYRRVVCFHIQCLCLMDYCDTRAKQLKGTWFQKRQVAENQECMVSFPGKECDTSLVDVCIGAPQVSGGIWVRRILSHNWQFSSHACHR